VRREVVAAGPGPEHGRAPDGAGLATEGPHPDARAIQSLGSRSRSGSASASASPIFVSSPRPSSTSTHTHIHTGGRSILLKAKAQAKVGVKADLREGKGGPTPEHPVDFLVATAWEPKPDPAVGAPSADGGGEDGSGGEVEDGEGEGLAVNAGDRVRVTAIDPGGWCFGQVLGFDDDPTDATEA